MANTSISKKKLKKIAQRKQSLEKKTLETRRQQKKKLRAAKLAEFQQEDAVMAIEQNGNTILGSVESHLMWY